MLRIAISAGVLATAFAITPIAARQSAQKSTAADKLPPLSYVCPMAGDEDVIEDKPGRCRKCGMELEPIRLDSVWTCPLHAAVTREKPGKCPLDGRDLVQMTMAVSWTCAGSTKPSLAPGTCPDGSPMQRTFTPRPHGNHNPQHGGAFFMAPDNWHHLEGAYFAPGVFRLYLYDDYTKPLPIAQVRATDARVILTQHGKEFPLVRNGRFLEAKVGKLPFPAVMQAKLKFQPAAPEHVFDFTFEKFSKDLPAPAPTLTAAPTATPTTGAPSSTTPAGGAPNAAASSGAAAPRPTTAASTTPTS